MPNKKRILVIGSPGAGKSTLATQLSCHYQLPLVRLDELQWEQKTVVARSIFNKRLEQVLQQSAWVIDGNYQASLRQRLEKADLVIWLQVPRIICCYRVVKRYLTYRGLENPLGNPDLFERAFLRYVWNFPKHNDLKISALLTEFAGDIEVQRIRRNQTKHLFE
ncbi:MAG: topology modulation protein [Enterococcus sp.]